MRARSSDVSRQQSYDFLDDPNFGADSNDSDEDASVGEEEDEDDDEEAGEEGDLEEDGLEDGDDDIEPAEIGSDLDAINSGAVTPAVVQHQLPLSYRRGNPKFNRKRETTVVIKGETYKVIDDELQLPDDARGETKIDADGNLLGGRTWKPPTFTSPLRINPNKVYLLSIDAARASGYRDSLYFFRRNPLVHKLTCSQMEKDKLIDLGKLSSNLKSRAVTMVSARNCFKIMGATFVENGRYIFDDYYESKSLEAGHKPGEPALVEPYDPDKDNTLAAAGGSSGFHSSSHQAPKHRPSNAPREDYISSQIGGGIHATFGGTGLQPFGKTWDPAAKKAKPAAHLSVENWMHEYAKSVAEANRQLGVIRKMNTAIVELGVDVLAREEDKYIDVEEEVEDEEDEGAMDLDGNLNSGAASPFPSHLGVGATASSSRDGTPALKKRKVIQVYNPIRGVYDPETNVPHIHQSTQPTRAKIEQLSRYPLLAVDGGDETTKEEEEGEGALELARKRRKLEVAGAKAGIATVEYVVDQEADQQEPLLPGMWDFRAVEDEWVRRQAVVSSM